MGNFNKGGNRGGGGGGFHGPRDSGRPSFQKKSWGDNNRSGGDRGEVTMHSATCSDCGKRCEVPFRPTGEKPVFCSDCFGSKRDGGSDRGDRFPKKEFGNDRPRENRDFSSPRPDSNRGLEDVKKQVEMLNTKIDALIKRFDSHAQNQSVVPVSKESLKEVVSRAQTPVKSAKDTKKKEVKVIAKPAKAVKKPAAKITIAKSKPAAKKKK